MSTQELMKAINKGSIEDVKLLLDKGADINPKDKYSQTALMMAVNNNYIEIVKLLIEKGADVNVRSYSQTVLHVAVSRGYTEIIELLIEKGADVNAKDEDGSTVLHVAVSRGYTEIIELLIEKGADINAKEDTYGRTALMMAVNNNYIEIVKLLIEKGADVNAKNIYNYGNTPLILAVNNNYIEIVKLLIEKGADVNAKNFYDYGNTPLMMAVNNNYILNIEIVKLLIEKGADVNAKNIYEYTPLMMAVNNNYNENPEENPEIVKLLIEKGADVNAQDKDGKTAADVALNKEIKNLLKGKMDKGTIEMWKGFTRGDIERLNGIFEDNAINYSLCPVCLKYVERFEACMYMYHNCNIIKGSYYHKRLYERFKDSKGIIKWCTFCSRICYGHVHYELARHDSKKKPELLISDTADPFENDCRVSNHGGGLPEKVLRFRRLRKVAKELQDEIGKISKSRALDKLVEEVWNAPLDKDTRAVNEIMKSKEWKNNINTRKFRSGKNSNNSNNANAPNIPFEGNKPTKLNSGMNDIMRMEDDNIIQFHHKQKDGSIKDHGCTEENLEKYIAKKLGEFGTANFGYCFLYPYDCDSRLHPEEVKGHIPDKLYKPYKEAFNIAFQGQTGGNSDNVFQEAEDAQCVIPKRGGNRNTRKKIKKNKKTKKTKSKRL